MEEWVLASWVPSPRSYEITVLDKPSRNKKEINEGKYRKNYIR